MQVRVICNGRTFTQDFYTTILISVCFNWFTKPMVPESIPEARDVFNNFLSNAFLKKKNSVKYSVLLNIQKCYDFEYLNYAPLSTVQQRNITQT